MAINLEELWYRLETNESKQLLVNEQLKEATGMHRRALLDISARLDKEHDEIASMFSPEYQ